jgi:hopanoid biosynthesis associated protein HpnK
MKRLIVNADDFGWSEAVTGGILQAHRQGVLTSTTVMANLPGADEALQRARREAPRLAIGLHLNLTEGEPLSERREVVELLDGNGQFRRSLSAVARQMQFSLKARVAAEKELERQILWAREHGLKPSHLDGHKHIHMMPALLPTVIALAQRHGIPAIRTTAEAPLAGLASFLPEGWTLRERLRQRVQAMVAKRWGVKGRRLVREAGLATTDWFFGIRATGGVSADLILHLLRHAPSGTGELMLHPGLADASPARRSRLNESRPLELAAACDPRVRREAETLGWTWVSYKDLNHD